MFHAITDEKYPELSGSYPESANSKSQNPESGIGGKMTIGYALSAQHGFSMYVCCGKLVKSELEVVSMFKF